MCILIYLDHCSHNFAAGNPSYTALVSCTPDCCIDHTAVQAVRGLDSTTSSNCTGCSFDLDRNSEADCNPVVDYNSKATRKHNPIGNLVDSLYYTGLYPKAISGKKDSPCG